MEEPQIGRSELRTESYGKNFFDRGFKLGVEILFLYSESKALVHRNPPNPNHPIDAIEKR
jgi:hypothetical protein